MRIFSIAVAIATLAAIAFCGLPLVGAAASALAHRSVDVMYFVAATTSLVPAGTFRVPPGADSEGLLS